VLLIALCFAAIAIVDLGPILRKRRWWDAVAWLVVFAPAIAIAVLLEMKVKVPSAMLLIGKVLKEIGLSY
jgi:hypothetical protein